LLHKISMKLPKLAKPTAQAQAQAQKAQATDAVAFFRGGEPSVPFGAPGCRFRSAGGMKKSLVKLVGSCGTRP